MMTEPRKPLWRDAAGVMTAFLIIAAFIVSGFIPMLIKLLFGQDVSFEQTWVTQMSTLLFAAFTYIIGAKKSQIKFGFDRPLCSDCPIRDAIDNADRRR